MPNSVVKKRVPLLDEHDILRPALDEHGQPVLGEDGRPKKLRVKIDKAKLARIAANNNRRVKETGDLVPIVVGHTKDDAPEESQPRIVGLAKNFVVARLGKTGRHAIHADLEFPPDSVKYLKAKGLGVSRRSVELWLDRMEIDPISLLGATTPERDLGLLHLSRSGHPIRYSRILYSHSPNMPNDNMQAATGDRSELVQEVLAAFMESDVGKAMTQLLEQMKGGAGAEPGAEDELPLDGQDETGDQYDEFPEEGAGSEEPATPPVEPPAEPEEPASKKAQYSANKRKYDAASASGSNTFTPDDGPVQMARDRAQMVRYERLAKQAIAEAHDMRVKYQRAIRERDLLELEGEGYRFDRTEELDHVTNMDEKTYQSHLNRIRVRYQHAPVRGSFIRTADTDPTPRHSGGNGSQSKRDMEAVISLSQSKGISYEQALSQVMGSNVL